MKAPQQRSEFRFPSVGQLHRLLAIFLLPLSASAATLVWDVNLSEDGSQDGAGTWNVGGNRLWWDAPTQTNVQYDNDSDHHVVFHGGGNPASNVTFNGSLFKVGGMTFTSETLPASNGNSHAFLGTTSLQVAKDSLFDVGLNARVNFASTIAIGAGDGFTKTGDGVLIFRNLAGTTGATVVNAGSLDIYGAAHFEKLTFTETGTLITHSSNQIRSDQLIYESSRSSPLAAPSGDSTYTIGSGGLIVRNGGLYLTANTHTTKLILEGNVAFDGDLATTFEISNQGTGTVEQKLIDLAGGNRTFDVQDGKLLRIQPIVQNGGVLKTGKGTLELLAANTYSGGTTIEEGRLLLSGIGTIGGQSATLQLESAGIFDLGGTHQKLGQIQGSGTIQNTRTSSSINTLTVQSDTLNSVFTGKLADVGSNGKLALVKSGTATLSLSGANTYTGGTTIQGGTLEIVDTQMYTVAGNNTVDKALGTGLLKWQSGTIKVRANGLDSNTTQQLRYDNHVSLEGDFTMDLARESGAGTGKQIRFGNLTVTEGGHTLTSLTAHNYVAAFSALNLQDHITIETNTVGNVITGGVTFQSAVNGAGFDIIKKGSGSLVYYGGTFRDVHVEAGRIDFFNTVTNRDVYLSGSGYFTTHSANTWHVDTLNYSSTSTTSNFYTAGGESNFNFNTINMSAGGLSWQTDSSTKVTDIIKVVVKDQINITGNASFLSTGSGLGQKLLDLNGGERTITVAPNVTFTNQIVIANGSYIKKGAGTLIVSAASIYNAGTKVQAGTLEVNNTSGSGTGSGSVQVSNATLSGIGTLAPASGNKVILGTNAILSPGRASQALGTLTIDGDVAFLAGDSVYEHALLSFQIGGTSAGQYDRLLITGDLDFEGNVQVQFANSFSGNQLVEGDRFDLLDWGSATFGGSNEVAFFDLPDLASFGLAWNTSQFSNMGVLSVISVPEPSRAVLFIFGAVLISILNRKRKTA